MKAKRMGSAPAATHVALLSLALLVIPEATSARSRYDATIVRSTYGIPHITARDHASLGFGVGYTAAQDNVCLIAEQLLTVRGERSRFLGAGNATVAFQQVPNLESDLFHKIVGDLSETRKSFAAASKDYASLVTGFVAGYNRYLKDHRGRLPASCNEADWVKPMSLDDALLMLGAAMLETGVSGFARQIASAAPPAMQSAGARSIDLPQVAERSTFGSNGWAFGKETTANGSGLLVGNPHFPWTGANRFRQMHLTIPGKLDVMGAGLAITPFIVIGFNKDLAWTHTVSTSQHVTVHELALDPANPTTYLVDGKPEQMRQRTVTVEVKGGPSVTRTVYSSRYGLLAAMPNAGLGWTSSRAFAINDANLFNQRSGDTWLRMAAARTVRDLHRIIGRTLGLPYVNTIAADRGGDVLYADVTAMPNVSAAKIEACGTPTGKAGPLQAQRIFVLDGSRSACAWDNDASTPVPGLMPAGAMPVSVRRDYVQNSNDSYWLTNPSSPLPAVSPLLGLTGTRPSFRTQSGILEIQSRLAGTDGLPGRKIDHEAAKTMTFANKSLAADRMLPGLLTVCAGDPSLAAPCQVLSKWDRRADVGSRGALLFFAFFRSVGQIPNLWAVPFDPADPVNTPRDLVTTGATAEGLRKALAAAAAELTALKVPLDAPLGAVQVAPRGAERIAIHGGPGNAGILNAMASRPSNGALVPVHGTSYVQVVGFGQRGPVADAVLSYSQSTDPASPHYADQTRAYSQKRWHRLPFTREEIGKAQISDPLRVTE